MSHNCEWCAHFGRCLHPGACERAPAPRRFEPLACGLVAGALGAAIVLLALAALAPAEQLVASVLSW